MKKYEVTFEDFNHDRCVIEIEAKSKEEALMEVNQSLSSAIRLYLRRRSTLLNTLERR